jgi:hypothetical protein
MLKNLLYIFAGIVVNILVLTFGMGIIFPKLALISKTNNKLDVRKMEVKLTDSVCEINLGDPITINTSDPSKANFKWLPESNNLKGGAQFSYSFWIDVQSGIIDTDKIIFSRGSFHQIHEGFVTKCPMITYNETSGKIKIHFNTLSKIENVIECDEPIFDMIRSGPNTPTWNLFSISFKDYVDFSNSEQGAHIQIFLNADLVKTVVLKNDAIKVNRNDVHFLPNWNPNIPGIGSTTRISNLTYYNYALDILSIQTIYEKGMANSNIYSCTTTSPTNADTLKLNYGRLSTWNVTEQL